MRRGVWRVVIGCIAVSRAAEGLFSSSSSSSSGVLAGSQLRHGAGVAAAPRSQRRAVVVPGRRRRRRRRHVAAWSSSSSPPPPPPQGVVSSRGVVSALESAARSGDAGSEEEEALIVAAAGTMVRASPREVTRASWAVARLWPRIRRRHAADEFFKQVAIRDEMRDRRDDEARHVATLLWALAVCDQGGRRASLAESLARRVDPRAFNARDCAQAAWGLAKLISRSAAGSSSSYAAALEAVGARALEVELKPFEMARVAWACGKTGHCLAFLHSLCADTSSLGSLTSRQGATVAWAMARTGTATRSALDALSAGAEGARGPAELANYAWAYATARRTASDEALRTVLGSVRANALVGNRLEFFTSRELANTAWALAKVYPRSGDTLFEVLAPLCAAKLAEFSAQEIANCAWACARACPSSQASSVLLDRVVKQVRPSRFASQGLSMTAWALATCGNKADAAFWNELAMVAARRIEANDFNGQDVATTVWALAKACDESRRQVPGLVSKIYQTRRQLDDLNSQELSMTAWGIATAWNSLQATTTTTTRSSSSSPLGESSNNPHHAFATEVVLDTIAEAAVDKIASFNSQELANTCWAFAKCRKLQPPLSTALSRAAVGSIATFETQHLANTAWAFAKAGIADADLFNAIAPRTREAHLSSESSDGRATAQLRQAALFLRHKAPHFVLPDLLPHDDDDDDDQDDAPSAALSTSTNDADAESSLPRPSPDSRRRTITAPAAADAGHLIPPGATAPAKQCPHFKEVDDDDDDHHRC